MKKKLPITILLLVVAFTSYAQKNFFNVPMAEMVETGKLYMQPGATISEQIQLSSVFTYGIGRHVQAGINVRDVTINYKSKENVFPYRTVDPAVNPDVRANLQTGFDLSNTFKIGLGTQSGYNIAGKGVDFSSFNYLNLQADVGQSKFVIGSYYGNDTFVVEGNNTGLMAGLEIPLGTDKVNLMADYISGTNARSSINLGLEFKVGPKWKLALGAQVPSPGSGNSPGGIIQFSN